MPNTSQQTDQKRPRKPYNQHPVITVVTKQRDPFDHGAYRYILKVMSIVRSVYPDQFKDAEIVASKEYK